MSINQILTIVCVVLIILFIFSALIGNSNGLGSTYYLTKSLSVFGGMLMALFGMR